MKFKKWLFILSLVAIIGLSIGFIGAKRHAAKADAKVITIVDVGDQATMADIQIKMDRIRQAIKIQQDRYDALRDKYKVPKEFVDATLPDSDTVVGWKEAPPQH
jgi:hypothetical protein